MSSERWSDRDLRAFVVRAPRLSWGDSELADVERRAFRAQLVAIAAPGIQARVLAEIGALTSPEGLAVLCCAKSKSVRVTGQVCVHIARKQPHLITR